ncbi:VWA domain-containing protein [Leuconostoc mesenteroides]|uniref:VWA domain-containing protein n=1 Tax=Leuconostoc mesenteroides TaxID=1245 RepID=UPI0009FFFE08|nr:VWA domain-containing protein [Leuconostoc mesenteroides]ORI94915.1 VWA domain-containing protein [Leuconostoc mesenteroides subsp. mesenteroides]
MKNNIHKIVNGLFLRVFGILLVLSTLVANALMIPLTTVSAASDITPQYTSNSTGVFPTNSWTIPGQNTVINHQGGDASNGWDKNSSWNGDSSDTSKSYLKFGTETSNPDYQIRKYAKETSTPGLYDVYLNAKGNEVKNIKPIDIVLVVDMSGSMEPANNPSGSNRAQATRDGVKQFLQAIKDAGISQYVNVGLVGFSSPGNYVTGSNGYLEVGMQSLSTTGQTEQINKTLSPTFSGGTFTQLGIRRGQKMLDDDKNDHKKMMILLTDGVPTFSYKVTQATTISGTTYGTAFSSSDQDQPGSTSQFVSGRNNWESRKNRYISGTDPNGATTSAQNYGLYYNTGNNVKIWNTWAATLGEAKISRDSGTEIHALGIQLGDDNNNNYWDSPLYLSSNNVRSRASLIASSGLYQDANSASDVETYLKNQAKDVLSQFNTVNQGSISDPLGSQFIYGDDTPTVKSVGSSVVQNLPTVTKSNGSISVSNINLGKDQEIQIHYQVLNESTDGYVSSITNKINESTITNTQYGLIIDKYASNSKNKLTGAEFIVKSTDGKQSYTLKDNQLQQLTPGDYTIQETKSPSGYQLDSTVYPITLSQDGKWSSSGQGINVKSPTTDGNGYKDGFSIATDKSNNTDKNNVVRFVKNDTFKKFNLTVNKVDKTTGNALKGAKFTLTDSDGKPSVYKETDPTSTFTFENLSSGTYTLKESKAPDGYIASKDVTIIISDDGSVKVTNNNGDWKSTLQNDAGNNQISLTVNNSNKTVFPSTGGTGIVRYMLIAGAFILIALGASGYYIFRIKRGNRS